MGRHMSLWPPKSRAPEYRERAAEARAKAESITDAEARKTMLGAADMWDRMADWEEQHGDAQSDYRQALGGVSG